MNIWYFQINVQIFEYYLHFQNIYWIFWSKEAISFKFVLLLHMKLLKIKQSLSTKHCGVMKFSADMPSCLEGGDISAYAKASADKQDKQQVEPGLLR